MTDISNSLYVCGVLDKGNDLILCKTINLSPDPPADDVVVPPTVVSVLDSVDLEAVLEVTVEEALVDLVCDLVVVSCDVSMT